MADAGLYIDIDESLKKRFKIKCAKEDISQKDVLAELIRFWLTKGFPGLERGK